MFFVISSNWVANWKVFTWISYFLWLKVEEETMPNDARVYLYITKYVCICMYVEKVFKVYRDRDTAAAAAASSSSISYRVLAYLVSFILGLEREMQTKLVNGL